MGLFITKLTEVKCSEIFKFKKNRWTIKNIYRDVVKHFVLLGDMFQGRDLRKIN